MRTIDGHLVGVYAAPADTRVWHWSVREDDKPMCGNGVGIWARSTGVVAAYAIECRECRSLFEGGA
jgi:hypothetical protein